MTAMRTTLAVIVLAILGSARLAAGADHNMFISEVLRSSGGSTAVQYVELLDAVNQPFPASPYGIEIYDADGVLAGSVTVTVPANTRRLYISTGAADAAFGTTGDALLDVALPTDGQVCFVRGGGGKIHCLAYGCVTTLAGTALQTSLGATPPDGMSVQRQTAGTYAVTTPTPDADNTVAAAGPACPGGTPDAGPTPDADLDAPDAEPGTPGDDEGDGGGCCSTGSEPGGAIVLGLLALVGLRRRD